MNVKEFYLDPFEYMNNLNLRIGKWDLNLLKNHVELRKTIFYYSIGTLVLWIVMGFDSGIGQFEFPLWKMIIGEASWTWADFWYWYHYAYGKTMHWSAFVIYGWLWIGVSLYLERKLGLIKTKNVVYSFCFTLFNIAVFEYFWMYSFAYWQNQWWVVKWAWPQLRILVQNLGFTVVGVFGYLFFWIDGHIFNDSSEDPVGHYYSYRIEKKFILILVLTVASMLVWYYYPGYVGKVQTHIEGYGLWENTRHFPQTLYTIDLDVTDKVNAGDWFWVENDLIHAWNTIVKSLLALVTYVHLVGWRKHEETSII